MSPKRPYAPSLLAAVLAAGLPGLAGAGEPPGAAAVRPGPATPDPTVPATPAPDPRALLLGAIDVFLTPERLAAAGVDEAYATRVLDDRTARRYLRMRAASALAILGGETARARLEAAAAEDADVQVRIQAVLSLARVWGPRDRQGVADRLRRLRTDAPAPLATVIDAELDRLLTRPDR